MIQIFDQLKIENERDWTLKISSAVEESFKYRFFKIIKIQSIVFYQSIGQSKLHPTLKTIKVRLHLNLIYMNLMLQILHKDILRI
ncbi:MAG: hypothetical protein CM15mP102_09950 [Flavobacteriales bacterium]|nr:MAG: hypothetical protein CM15mP102_09950 [Flavobacteriales bacterium]